MYKAYYSGQFYKTWRITSPWSYQLQVILSPIITPPLHHSSTSSSLPPMAPSVLHSNISLSAHSEETSLNPSSLSNYTVSLLPLPSESWSTCVLLVPQPFFLLFISSNLVSAMGSQSDGIPWQPPSSMATACMPLPSASASILSHFLWPLSASLSPLLLSEMAHRIGL